jgi:hypothetical protein
LLRKMTSHPRFQSWLRPSRSSSTDQGQDVGTRTGRCSYQPIPSSLPRNEQFSVPGALENLSREYERLSNEISTLKSACQGWETAWSTCCKQLQLCTTQILSLEQQVCELKTQLDSQVSSQSLALHHTLTTSQASPGSDVQPPIKLDMATAKDRRIRVLRKKLSRQEVYACPDGAADEAAMLTTCELE